LQCDLFVSFTIGKGSKIVAIPDPASGLFRWFALDFHGGCSTAGRRGMDFLFLTRNKEQLWQKK
jgi:hypothetical protein